jgi:hypothetical protein
MTLTIRTFNLLLFEPASVRPELRIAQSVLTAVESKANALFQDGLLPELVRLGLIPPRTGLAEFAAHAHELPALIAGKVAVPEDERFIVNVAPYERLGGVPGILGDFANLYAEMAPQGIAVVIFNTACRGAPAEYARLAEVMDSFPALRESTWLVTSSLREPMPEAFRALIERRAGAANPAGAAARRLAVTTGSPCYIPIGDSIVLRAAGEAAAIVHDRLKFLRKFGRQGS